MARDWRDERIAELDAQLRERDAQLRERDAQIVELKSIIAAQSTQIAALLARVAHLEERVGRSSGNSSKPPSSDGPKQAADQKLKRAKASKGRRPGGQPGRLKCTRALVPASEVTTFHTVKPSNCAACRRTLRGADANPTLHQVAHLPEVKPLIEQWTLHALSCPCGHTTRAQLPAGVPRGAFGPSVVAVIAVLIGACRAGKRVTQSVMADLFGLEMSLGAVVGCQKRASQALAKPVQEAVQFVQHAKLKHADETSWFEGPQRVQVWLWVAVTAAVTVFAIQASRSTKAAQALLGKAKGILVSDRYSGYSWWPLSDRQICWAHLMRDFTAISERPGEAKHIGLALLDEGYRLFHWWHRVRDGDLSRKNFHIYTRSLQNRVRALLVQAQTSADEKTARTCKNLLKSFPALWLFIDTEGVPPTNNPAEGAIRHGVIWRKTSFGTHSEHGSRFVERMLTTHATLRQQKRNLTAFIRQACEAQLSGSESPSLLPTLAIKSQLAKAA